MPRWDAASWDERYGASDAPWSGHLRHGPGEWEVVTAEARARPGAHPDGHDVTLHDTVLVARRTP